MRNARALLDGKKIEFPGPSCSSSFIRPTLDSFRPFPFSICLFSLFTSISQIFISFQIFIQINSNTFSPKKKKKIEILKKIEFKKKNKRDISSRFSVKFLRQQLIKMKLLSGRVSSQLFALRDVSLFTHKERNEKII